MAILFLLYEARYRIAVAIRYTSTNAFVNWLAF